MKEFFETEVVPLLEFLANKREYVERMESATDGKLELADYEAWSIEGAKIILEQYKKLKFDKLQVSLIQENIGLLKDDFVMEIPKHINKAAAELEDFFFRNGCHEWEFMGISSRKLTEKLERRIKELEKTLNEIHQVVIQQASK